MFYNYERIHSGVNYKSPYKKLLNQGLDVNKLFSVQEQTQGNIFLGLSKTEASSAEEQLVRDSLAE